MVLTRKLGKNANITIPKALRVKLGWKCGTSLDIEVQEDGTILVRKHCPTCRFCGAYQDIRKFKDLYVCKDCAEEMKGSIYYEHQ